MSFIVSVITQLSVLNINVEFKIFHLQQFVTLTNYNNSTFFVFSVGKLLSVLNLLKILKILNFVKSQLAKVLLLIKLYRQNVSIGNW